MGKQRFWLIGIAILVGAFVLRLAYLLQVKDLPFYYHPILDAGFFQRWAAYKQHVSWLEAGVPFRQPLYAYFLAVIFAGLRDSLNLVRVIQLVRLIYAVVVTIGICRVSAVGVHLIAIL